MLSNSCYLKSLSIRKRSNEKIIILDIKVNIIIRCKHETIMLTLSDRAFATLFGDAWNKNTVTIFIWYVHCNWCNSGRCARSVFYMLGAVYWNILWFIWLIIVLLSYDTMLIFIGIPMSTLSAKTTTSLIDPIFAVSRPFPNLDWD